MLKIQCGADINTYQISSILMQSSHLALESLKKEWMSTANWSKSNFNSFNAVWYALWTLLRQQIPRFKKLLPSFSCNSSKSFCWNALLTFGPSIPKCSKKEEPSFKFLVNSIMFNQLLMRIMTNKQSPATTLNNLIIFCRPILKISIILLFNLQTNTQDIHHTAFYFADQYWRYPSYCFLIWELVDSSNLKVHGALLT